MAGTMNKGTLDKGSLVKTFGGSGSSPTPPAPQGEYFVKVIDYDGTVLDEQWLDDGAEYTLPASPDRTDKGLVFQEWSCSQAITDGKITIDKNDVMIGAIYTTVSGQNEFDIEVNANTGLTFALNMNGTKDWGDGTTDTNTSHTYSQAGKYTIKCDGTTITASSSSGIFGQNDTYATMNFTCLNVRFATVQTIPNYAFNCCKSIQTISLSNSVKTLNQYCLSSLECDSLVFPSDITSLPNYVCYGCHFKRVVLPNTITSINSSAFSNNYDLNNVVLPESLTTIGTDAFGYCYDLEKLVLPKNVTTIGGTFTYSTGIVSYSYALKEFKILSTKITRIASNTFKDCDGLEKVEFSSSITTLGYNCFEGCVNLPVTFVVPSSITKIEGNVFTGLRQILEYDFSSATAIPTLDNVSAFNYPNKLMKIKVPSALYDQWITETNWSALADYIVAV